VRLNVDLDDMGVTLSKPSDKVAEADLKQDGNRTISQSICGPVISWTA